MIFSYLLLTKQDYWSEFLQLCTEELIASWMYFWSCHSSSYLFANSSIFFHFFSSNMIIIYDRSSFVTLLQDRCFRFCISLSMHNWQFIIIKDIESAKNSSQKLIFLVNFKQKIIVNKHNKFHIEINISSTYIFIRFYISVK